MKKIRVLRVMTKIKLISTEDGKESVELHQSKEGAYVLRIYVQRYDFEEEVYYEVRVTPDPAGLFGDANSATQEAKLLLGLE